MINILIHHFSEFASGFGVTLMSSVIALIGAMTLGVVFALLQIVPNKFINLIGRVYVEIFRNIPLLLVTMFFYVFVAQIFKLDGFTAGTIGLALYTSSFIAEVVRSSINALDGGQLEGARANGLTWWQSMRYVILPQAFRLSIPNLGNQFINLVKNSSVLAFVAGMDLMYTANNVAAETFDTINSYILVALFYLIITLPLSYYMRYLERKMGGSAS